MNGEQQGSVVESSKGVCAQVPNNENEVMKEEEVVVAEKKRQKFNFTSNSFIKIKVNDFEL